MHHPLGRAPHLACDASSGHGGAGATAHAVWDVLATHFCGCSQVRCHAPSLSHPGSGSGSIFMRDIAPTVRGTLRLSHNLPAEDDLRPDPLPSGCVSSCRHLVELRSTLTRCGPLKVGSRATRTAKNSTTHTERTKYIVTVPRTLAGQCWNRPISVRGFFGCRTETISAKKNGFCIGRGGEISHREL